MTEIYAVTGMPLAGKTSIAAILESEGFAMLDMGDVVRRERKERDMPVSQTAEFVENMREERGMEVFAELSEDEFTEMLEKNQKVVITGMRNIEEKRYYEHVSGETVPVIAVWASPSTRLERMRERSRDEDVRGQEFRERDSREIDQGVSELMALSDYMIKNDSKTLEQVEETIKEEILG